MQRRIQVKLTKDSINNAIRELADYKAEIKRKTSELTEALASEGVFIAKTWIIAYGAYETGDLMNSIEGIFDASTGRGFIKATSDHAAYVEYGTGVVGLEHQGESPDRPAGWDYDTNEHGHDGWYYYTSGYKRWTKGMPPRPFMYQTFIELSQKAHEIAKVKFTNG